MSDTSIAENLQKLNDSIIDTSKKLYESKFYRYLNEQKYYLYIQLRNGKQKYDILPNHIINLQLENDLLEWPLKGNVTIHNPYEMTERARKQIDNGEPSDKDILYLFRGDARNEIEIIFKPMFETDMELPEKIWTIKFIGIIYDTDDPQETNITAKTKRLYFHDLRYQFMLEKNMQWSTAQYAENPDQKHISDLSNYGRSIYSGEALKKLLIDGGFEPIIDEENWDKGINKIFYTSPTQYTIADDIQSILGNHISNKGDKCILHYNRQIGKLQLIPIHDFFKRAGNEKDNPGELQIEHLFLEDTASDSPDTNPYKAPILNNQKTFDRDLKMHEYGRILTYDFIDMAGLDNMYNVCDKPVFWYHGKKRTFGVDFEYNTIEESRKAFNQIYVNKLYKMAEQPLLTLNKMKKEHYNINPQFTYASSGDGDNIQRRSFSGRASILFSSVFLNQCIYIRLLGAPCRMAGTFVGIDRLNTSSDEDGELDKKLCGQWFVINVKHNIYYTKYVTDIIAVKVHAFDKLKINEDVE